MTTGSTASQPQASGTATLTFKAPSTAAFGTEL